ncbi:MAG: GntR family transcriptional regulator [Granulosicoccus sp.]
MSTGLVKSQKHLSTHVYDSLFRMIRERELRGGDTIVESHVSEKLGVSRTPLREAMQRLESHGMLQKGANRSFQVRQVELKEYLQSLKVREVLEAEAVALAIDRVSPEQILIARDATRELENTDPYDKLAHWRADDLVHHLFIKNCGNDVMVKLILSLRVTTQLFEIERLSDRLGPDSREHERILNAIESKDRRAARKYVADHIRSLFDFAVQSTV